ncbi:hypothetical protein DI119_11480 [Legionella pneumophila]|nr:hypothetical protein C3926_00990 [Legionella pneumophila]TIG62485.1 hypothetical protein DI132_11610 [Legionella pneumophila]TIG70503.1 hypothetical protein DI104_11820 [Legionella pneumophila]TIG75294.1 hypothetical protein DI119_11480 [Legionella pneumophila]TIG80926.1 hypothetical protein DI139_11165 [Legionella pneumophila]
MNIYTLNSISYSLLLITLFLGIIKNTTANTKWGLIIGIVVLSNIDCINGLSLNEILYSLLGTPSLFTDLLSFSLSIHYLGYNTWCLNRKSKHYLLITSFLFYCSYLNYMPINIFYLHHLISLYICLLLSLFVFFIDKYLGYIYLLAITAGLVFLPNSYSLFTLIFDPTLGLLLLLSPLSYRSPDDIIDDRKWFSRKNISV